MRIREVTSADAAALAEIYKYYVEHFPYSFEYDPPSPEEFAYRIHAVLVEYPFFVCEENGEVIGFSYAHQFGERKAYQWICETSIYTRMGCSQKGVGRLLYEKLLPALKAQGFVKAYAVLGCPNEGSEIFHQKMGFTYEATLPQVGYKLGGWHDIKYYSFVLNEWNENMPTPLAYRQIRDNKNEG